MPIVLSSLAMFWPCTECLLHNREPVCLAGYFCYRLATADQCASHGYYSSAQAYTASNNNDNNNNNANTLNNSSTTTNNNIIMHIHLYWKLI